MKILGLPELQAQSVTDLGLDASASDLTAPEALAALLRRAAIYRCPCSPRSLIDAVLVALRGIIPAATLREDLESTLDALVGYGDLVELTEVKPEASRASKLIYVAPPSFVIRKSGTIFLIGAFDNWRDSFSDLNIELVGHVRKLHAGKDAPSIRQRLLEQGFIELPDRAWLLTPPTASASVFHDQVDKVLDKAAPCSQLPGLIILGPKSGPTYKARWVKPQKYSGRFIGRRAQLYGSDLWCYLELKEGVEQRFVDLPLDNMSKTRPCDEAWRIQMSLDALANEPQEYKIRSGPAGHSLIDFFSPIPSWAQRRLDAIGNPVPPSNCLLSYSIPNEELAQEKLYLENSLWLAPRRGS